MSIRDGKYLDENRQPVPEFFDMVNEYEKRLEYAKNNTDLPRSIDKEKIYDLMETVNEITLKSEGFGYIGTPPFVYSPDTFELKTPADVENFLKAISEAENAPRKHVELSRPCRNVSRGEIKEFFKIGDDAK